MPGSHILPEHFTWHTSRSLLSCHPGANPVSLIDGTDDLSPCAEHQAVMRFLSLVPDICCVSYRWYRLDL